MKLLKLAIENQRWDLAAHIIVLATAKLLKDGEKKYVTRNRGTKKGRSKGQSER